MHIITTKYLIILTDSKLSPNISRHSYDFHFLSYVVRPVARERHGVVSKMFLPLMEGASSGGRRPTG